MVCTRKSSAVAAVATAASSYYGGYNATAPTSTPVASGSFAQPAVAAVAAPDSSSSSAAAGAANSGIKGFNYGAFFLDQQAKVQNDFEYEFTKAQNLANTTGWNSARLYTTGKCLCCFQTRDPPPHIFSRDVDLPHRGVDLTTGHGILREDLKLTPV